MGINLGAPTDIGHLPFVLLPGDKLPMTNGGLPLPKLRRQLNFKVQL